MGNRVIYGEYQLSLWPMLLGAAGVLALILFFVIGLAAAVRLVWQAGPKGTNNVADTYNKIEEKETAAETLREAQK